MEKLIILHKSDCVKHYRDNFTLEEFSPNSLLKDALDEYRKANYVFISDGDYFKIVKNRFDTNGIKAITPNIKDNVVTYKELPTVIKLLFQIEAEQRETLKEFKEAMDKCVNNMTETIGAKIRNSLTPYSNLVAVMNDYKNTKDPEKRQSIMKYLFEQDYSRDFENVSNLIKELK